MKAESGLFTILMPDPYSPAVAQIGAPNDFNYQFGYDLDVHPDKIGFIAHAVARDEHRALFPLTSLSGGYGNDKDGFVKYGWLGGPKAYLPVDFKEYHGVNYWEKPFQGVHSDIGGGYQNARNLAALRWMIKCGKSAGAPFNELSKATYKDFSKLKDLNDVKDPHDSRYPVLDWGAARRDIFPGNIQP